MGKKREKNTVPITLTSAQYRERLGGLALAISMLVIALFRLRIASAPLERDEGEYAYAGQLILKGVAPFVEAYNMKMPGIYAAYAGIMAVFGQTAFGIHLGLLLVNSAAMVMLYVLVRRHFDVTHAVISSVTYGWMSLSSGVLGAFAHATHFNVLFGLGALLLTLRPGHRIRWWDALLSGLLWGCAFMMKQHAAPFIVVAGVHLLYLLVRDERQTALTRATSAVLFGAGVFAPFVLTCLIEWRAGVFKTFWFWTIDYARAYAGAATSPGANFSAAFSSMVPVALFLWLMTAAGLVGLWKYAGKRAFLLSMLIAACIAVSAGLYFRTHYFVLMLPVAAVLAAIGAHALANALPENFRKAAGMSAPLLIAGIAWGQYLLADRAYLLLQTPVEVSRALYGVNPFTESIEIGRYLREHMAESDKMAVLGSEPQIMFYAQRRSCTGFVYTYPLMEDQQYAPQMQAQMINEIEKGKPKYIVFVLISMSWKIKPTSDPHVMQWAPKYVQREYDRVGLVDIFQEASAVYWDDKQVGRKPESQYSVAIFKRKGT